ncbi:hypothetical protein ACQ4PT_036366 [Festuca glaucescens]
MEPPWSELPEDLLALIFRRFFFPDYRARLQVVCRSWRSPARPHRRQLPWIMLPFGGFVDPSDRILHRLSSYPETASSVGSRTDYHVRRLFSFRKTTKCIGSTDGWIALDCVNAENRHNYLLHNVFSCTTLSLPELDAVIGHVSKLFEIRKVLLRSTPDDVIAVLTNHCSCPIILTRRGKGVWLPKGHAPPLVIIIDVAFLGDRLYGITLDEDLVYFDIADDDNGVPMITGGKCVIGGEFHVWSDEEDYDDDGDDGDDEDYDDDDDAIDDDDDEEDDNSDYDEEYDNNVDDIDDDDHRYQDEDYARSDSEDEHINDDHDDHDERENNGEHTYDLTKMTKEDMTGEGIKFVDADKSLHDDAHHIEIRWHLIESCGKLLMVRRQVLSAGGPFDDITHKVDVFEADISGAMWVPVRDGIGGQALFISELFYKSISATCSEEIQEDAIYFIDTDDVFDMRSQTVSAPRYDWLYRMTLQNIGLCKLTWVFPPELVA